MLQALDNLSIELQLTHARLTPERVGLEAEQPEVADALS